MFIFVSWEGLGLLVLLMFPLALISSLLVSVNFVGREFTREHFREIVIGSVIMGGLICLPLGYWLNREKVVRRDQKKEEILVLLQGAITSFGGYLFSIGLGSTLGWRPSLR